MKNKNQKHNNRYKIYFNKYNKQLFSIVLFILLLIIYSKVHPRGLSTYVLTILSNQGVGLAFPSIGQTIVMLTSGIDLSIGGIFSLTNTIASELVDGSISMITLGLITVILVGGICGLINGLIIVFGKIQPIIATLSTGYIYSGIALYIRPVTGGHVNENLSSALTYDLIGIPCSLILLILIVILIWAPLKYSKYGISIYSTGSSENSAFMSGVPIKKAKIIAYSIAGIFAAFGGLFVSFQTMTGDAFVGSMYTTNSIAASVLGGTSLLGGVGGVIGTVLGSFNLRMMSSIMFFTGVPPLAQPLFEGLLLIIALALGSTRLIGIKNRLEILG